MNNEATMRAKLATLQAENRKLRRIAQNSRQSALLDRITIDAQQLLIWRFSGLSIARRAAEEMGMSQRRWTWARALLQHARIHDDMDVTAADFDGALTALESSVNYLHRAGLGSLKMRLPQHVLLANQKAKAAANPPVNNGVQKLANSRVDAHSRGDAQKWGGSDRRRDVEARHIAREVQR